MAIVGGENHMVMFFNLGRIKPHPARHPKMEDHRIAPVCIDQPVFRAAVDPLDPRTDKALAEVLGQRPAQIRSPRFRRNKALPNPDLGQTPGNGFDFGKLRHFKKRHMGGLRVRQGSVRGLAMEQVSYGYQDVAPDEKTRRVRSVFERVAARYDLMNDMMSGGMHRLWKDSFVSRLKPRTGEHILDMAGGTGDIAFRMAAKGAQVTVADINPEMLKVGMARAEARRIDGLTWTEENAETLSFPSAQFDAYTIAFGIRNVTDIPAALREAHRVLKFGGRFFCLEFSTTTWPGFGAVYDAYSHKVVPKIGGLVAGDEEAYRYLIESIRRFPDMPTFRTMISAAGFSRVSVEPILGGLVAIHSGWKT